MQAITQWQGLSTWNRTRELAHDIAGSPQQAFVRRDG
jgi:hypothetical protein